MSPYQVFQVDAFTNEKFTGNPAGVVSNADGLTDIQMQNIAKELNNSETAFILSPTAGDHEVWLRYFTPKTEVPICGHATIAAHFVRARMLDLPSCTFNHKTGAGVLPITIEKLEKNHQITMTQGDIEIDPPLARASVQSIITALGLTGSDINPTCPIQIVSTGHSKVIIGIKSRATLNRLSPDWSKLTRLSKKIGCNGYFVFTFDSPDSKILTWGRMFAPAIGINEDPVTGNANGPLGAYMVHHNLVAHNNFLFSFKGGQGEAMKRPGTVNVKVDIENNTPVRTRVGGQAVMVFQFDLTV